jgi:hypothetical protein
VLACGLALLGLFAAAAHAGRPISYAQMQAQLDALPKGGFITVTEEGRSVEGRRLMLVRLNRGGEQARFKVLYYAQQHGNEVSGKDALLALVARIARQPELLPEDIDLYVMPMVNPDGAEAGTRSNAAGADLNRDHLLLAQPETRALHRVAHRVRPHLAVDGHEYGMDSDHLLAKGWQAWPEITLDAANHPLISPALRREGVRTVERMAGELQGAGFSYRRYYVGGPPPEVEMRPSSPEADDGRNALGSLGALSFIIEAGIYRKAPDPQADLERRVQAYLALFQALWGDRPWRDEVRQLAQQARDAALPPFLATNTFWGNVNGVSASIRVVDRRTGQPVEVPTAALMTDLVVKGSVPTPLAYAVAPAAAASFAALLRAHGVQFEILREAQPVSAERVTLLRIETDFDEVYQRYEGRHITRRAARAAHTLPAGSLLVPLAQAQAIRAVQLLEPESMHGMYVYPGFAPLARPGEDLPVLRVYAQP